MASAIFSVGMLAFPMAGGPRWLVLAVLTANEVLVGVGIMLFDVTVGAFVITDTPRQLLGRVNTSLSTVTQGVKALGALTGGAIATAVGIRPALWVAAIGATTTVLWVWFSPFRPRGAVGRGCRPSVDVALPRGGQPGREAEQHQQPAEGEGGTRPARSGPARRTCCAAGRR